MNKQQLAEKVANEHRSEFGMAPNSLYLAPGRINIIGEHVDYNNGFVLPAAIDKYVCIAISQASDDECVIVATDINERYSFSLLEQIKPVEQMWANYFLGVFAQLIDRRLPVRGFRIVFSSTIPIGAGLSSSAAVECGFCYAVNDLFDLKLTKQEMALIGQRAEHTFVGVQCGIMDQFACVFGKKNNVIKLDCDTLEYEYHDADFGEYSILLLDSNVKHTLLSSNYNTRREEVERGLSQIRQRFPEVRTFRDCTTQHLHAMRSELGEVIFKRCDYVVREIHRVSFAVDALECKNIAALGQLLFETHQGLSKDYEVSCEETDFLVDAVRNDPDVAGARMMGGGFGGCTINLVRNGKSEALIDRVANEYKKRFDVELRPYEVAISDGTSKYQI
ncbi:MAG: galactokinase [Flavobacterium sp.]|nr:MAG: galactokinase [Flavobacterium sp.]